MIIKNNNVINKMYKGSDIVNKINSNIESHTSRLPSGYTEVEWVGSNGTSHAYINTGLQLMDAVGTSFSIEGRVWTEFFVTDDGFGYLLSTESTTRPYPGFCWRWDVPVMSGTLSFAEKNANATLSTTDKGDGTSAFTISTNGISTTNNNIPFTLFAGLTGTSTSNTAWRFGRAKFYDELKITKNNVLVANYIPCQRESDNKYGFYDLVTSTFLTSANSGSLIGGNPVQPTGSTDIVAFQYIVNEQQPYDAQVEYLESDGASYIDTGLYLNTSNFEIGYDMLGNQLKWGFTHQGSGNGTWITVESVNAFFGNFSNRATISTNNTENVIKYESTSGITVNGNFYRQTFVLGTDSISSRPLFIFAMYDFRNGIDYGTTKLKSFYLKNNGELVLDMIPVRKDGVGYMYDRVSGQLFANAGTGSFIIGPDV